MSKKTWVSSSRLSFLQSQPLQLAAVFGQRSCCHSRYSEGEACMLVPRMCHFGSLHFRAFHTVQLLLEEAGDKGRYILWICLTPKVLWLCYHQKHSKTAISSTSTKFLKKNFFLTCVTVWSCSMLVWEDVIKNSQIFAI